MHKNRVAFLLLLGLVAPAQAQEREEAPPRHEDESAEAAPADPVERLEEAFEAAQQAFFEKWRQLEDEKAKEELFEKEYPKPDVWAEKFLEVARAHPGTDIEARALAWAADALPPNSESRREALRALVERHLDSPALERVCQGLVYDTSQEAQDFLRRVAEDSPHRAVRAQALYSLASSLKFAADRGNQDALAEAERLFERVREEFGDVPRWGETLGQLAERDLYEIRHLAIGMVAPEIEGEDVDGVPFRLSDYRGKVVLLDFWGDW